jgi:outer membrane protein OmpA-like peptidoglycan-associated protein
MDERINAYTVNFNPAISGNGSHMIYSAKIGSYYHIFYCQNIDGKWSDPEDITNQLKTNKEGISCSLSYDGKKLFLFKNDGGLANLYESKMLNGEWTRINKLNKNINTKYWESSCSMTPDGQTLYFSSNRKDGYGGLDIYKSELTSLGDWGPAINLGPDINTPLHEDSPFITTDNKTLYFSSQGHYNMGGFDLFYSTYMDNGKWSVPINLGFPVNTTDDDKFLAPVGKGDSAYYAHFTTQGLPKQEIYLLTFDTQESLSEITVKGTINLKDKIPDLDSIIFVHIIDTTNWDTLQVLQPDPNTGEYSFPVSPGDYKMVITGQGYETVTKQLSISGNSNLPDITLNPILVSKEVTDGKYIFIRNIYFDFNDFSLNKEDKIELERMVGIMIQYPSLEFEIIGHTDVIGPTSYNLQLSRNRARTVLDYLIDNGIHETRLKSKGVGEIVAIVMNTLEDGTDNPERRKLNRRVEFRILKSDPNLVIKEETYIPDYLRNDKDLKYTIIVMKVKEKLPDDFFNGFNMEELRYIGMEEAEDGYLYTLGIFIQKIEAIRVVGKLYEAGFSEARIVDQHELSELIVSEAASKKILFGNPEGIESIPVYTIQIYALLKPPDINAFKNIDNVRVTHGKDKFYRYTVGEYIRYRVAKQALLEFVKKGYQDAFIRPITDLE